MEYDYYNEELDDEVIQGLTQKIINAAYQGADNRVVEQNNNLYHMKRLAEQAEGMTDEEALMMCKHFDPNILLMALSHHLNIAREFQNQFITITKDMVDKLNS